MGLLRINCITHNGNEEFTDVSDLFSITDLIGYVLIGGWSDFDNDVDYVVKIIDVFPDQVEAYPDNEKRCSDRRISDVSTRKGIKRKIQK